ncbi:MAG: hypothetical protein ACKPKO_28485, partial [Candidatus Fonsibacter sp.]
SKGTNQRRIKRTKQRRTKMTNRAQATRQTNAKSHGCTLTAAWSTRRKSGKGFEWGGWSKSRVQTTTAHHEALDNRNYNPYRFPNRRPRRSFSSKVPFSRKRAFPEWVSAPVCRR